MPSHLSHSDYWRLQAQEARLTAQRLEDPEAKAAMLKKADEYDRLAACNSAWEAELRSAAKNRASRRRRESGHLQRKH